MQVPETSEDIFLAMVVVALESNLGEGESDEQKVRLDD